jgi:cytoskeletal protein CcmA (bactofilin family)
MAQQAARREGALGEITTLLGRGSSFEGKLTFEGTVRVDGKFKGEVFSDDVLVVGEGAYLEAEVDIGEIIIQGTVVGNIRAKRSIEIHAPCRVKGDIHTPSLQIDKGVMFEGRSFMDGAVAGPGAKPAGSPAGGGGGGGGGMTPRPGDAPKPAGPTPVGGVGPQPVK